MLEYEDLERVLERLADEPAPPECGELGPELDETIRTMHELPETVRPRSESSAAGGLVLLRPAIPTLVIPDLHGRRGFFQRVMTLPLFQGRSFLQLLEEDRGQVVCVGDAFHGESPVRERWQRAYKEYVDDYRRSKAMHQEMNDNLRLLQMIMAVKRRFPASFFFLKGNHENIANELGEGNYPFRKFVSEGEMVRYWTLRFLGEECFNGLYAYEKTLPLVASGDGFLVTHAEPLRDFSRDEIINAYRSDEVLYGLTWTDNGEAAPGSVGGMLENFFPGRPGTLCFGGHRPVRGLYALRNDERYVQINHPVAHIAAVIGRGEDFRPEDQIFRIDSED